MSNKPKRRSAPPPRPSAAGSGSGASGSGTSPVVWIAAVVALGIVIAVIVAFSVGGGDDDDGAAESAAAGETLDPDASVGEIAFAEIIGQPLPTFSEPDPAQGQPVPTISAQTFTGERLQIGGDGTARLIGFFAHWCPHCQDEVPELQAFMDAGGNDSVDLYAVTTSTSRVRPNFPPGAWLEEENWTAPTILDDEGQTAGQAFGVTAFPFWVLLDENNQVVGRFSGRVPAETIPAVFEIAAAGGGDVGGGPASGNE